MRIARFRSILRRFRCTPGKIVLGRNAAVSFISPIFHNVTVKNLAPGLALICDNFQTSCPNENVLCFPNRTHVIGEERYYGRRLSVTHVNSDTIIGVPLRESIDNLASFRLHLVNALTMDSPANINESTDYVVCISVYRLKH